MSETLRQDFLEGMSYAANTVSIVATDGPAGRAGVTISAMTSVTADGPGPSLLVCIHHKSAACRAVLENGVFTLNVLRESQSAVSDTFAGRLKTEGGDKFTAGRWEASPGGAPRLADALVSFACRITHSVEVGTHHVIFGAVEDIALGEGDRALIYANRAYGAAAPLLPPPPPQSSAHLTVAAFAPVAPYVAPAIVARLAAEAPDLEIRLKEGDDDMVRAALADGSADIGLLYDFRLGPDYDRVPLARLAPYALLPAGHPLAHQDEVSLAALAAEPLVVIDIPPSRDYALSLFASAGLAPRVAWHAGSFETARGLVGHGLGVAILATKPANALTYDGLALAARPLREKAEESQLVAATLRGAPGCEATRRFLQAARAHFGLAPAASS